MKFSPLFTSPVITSPSNFSLSWSNLRIQTGAVSSLSISALWPWRKHSSACLSFPVPCVKPGKQASLGKVLTHRNRGPSHSLQIYLACQSGPLGQAKPVGMWGTVLRAPRPSKSTRARTMARWGTEAMQRKESGGGGSLLPAGLSLRSHVKNTPKTPPQQAARLIITRIFLKHEIQ